MNRRPATAVTAMLTAEGVAPGPARGAALWAAYKLQQICEDHRARTWGKRKGKA